MSCDSLLDNASSRVDDLHTMRAVGWAVAGGGGAIFVTGAVLVLTAPDPHKYDEKPVNRLFVGWRVIPQIGIGNQSVTVARSF